MKYLALIISEKATKFEIRRLLQVIGGILCVTFAKKVKLI